jgi:uncharacterized protein (DUF924 family)
MTPIEEVLEFWFGELADGFATPAARKRWFTVDPRLDAEIAARFRRLLDEAASGLLTHWQDSARGCLAFIIVTDQFSRQIHRGEALAFATDALALAATHAGLQQGFDMDLAYDARTFFYMPLEHSETLADQELAVAQFRRLRDATPEPYRHLTNSTLQFAERHRDIIRQFGRFPHRNTLLGRISTDAERQFLQTASRFGQ